MCVIVFTKIFTVGDIQRRLKLSIIIYHYSEECENLGGDLCVDFVGQSFALKDIYNENHKIENVRHFVRL